MYGRVLCCAHCLIRPMSCFLLKNSLSTWFHVLHHGEGLIYTIIADFGVSPPNYFLLNPRHPSYQILATPLLL